MIRVHFAYHTIEQSWGGANNFLRALRRQLERERQLTFVEAFADDGDVLFMNQLGRGPGKGQYALSSIARRLAERSPAAPGGVPRPALVVRAVNLYKNVFGPSLRNLTLGRLRDWKVVRLLNMADLVIFQSAYQRQLFARAGYRGTRDVVIHNGADEAYWAAVPAHPPLEDRLRLISSTASPRGQKRHDLVARLSALADVEVRHLGAWPAGVDRGSVTLLGLQPRDAVASALASAHYFLHAGIKDACPNVLFEAMTAGLPVIYNPGVGSSREIVGACGLPLDEHDLAATVRQARAQLTLRRQAVLDRRPRFTIAHAAASYVQAFERAVGTRPGLSQATR